MGRSKNKKGGGKPPVRTPSSTTASAAPPKKCFYLVPEHYIPSTDSGAKITSPNTAAAISAASPGKGGSKLPAMFYSSYIYQPVVFVKQVSVVGAMCLGVGCPNIF